MDYLSEEIAKRIIELTNLMFSQAKKQVVKVRDVALYPSEVHMLLMIKNDIDTNATEMAKHLCLTKGAVSQTISRLEKKGIIIKTKDAYNKNELSLTLSELGNEVYAQCQSIRDSFMGKHLDYISKLTPNEKEIVLFFLENMNRVFDGKDAP